jgi:hypothetical protein
MPTSKCEEIRENFVGRKRFERVLAKKWLWCVDDRRRSSGLLTRCRSLRILHSSLRNVAIDLSNTIAILCERRSLSSNASTRSRRVVRKTFTNCGAFLFGDSKFADDAIFQDALEEAG